MEVTVLLSATGLREGGEDGMYHPGQNIKYKAEDRPLRPILPCKSWKDDEQI